MEFKICSIAAKMFVTVGWDCRRIMHSNLFMQLSDHQYVLTVNF